MDLDALSKSEGKAWVFRGARALKRGSDRLIVSLSNGGSDATVLREFDLRTKTFVPGGFTLPESKNTYGFLENESEWIVGAALDAGSATDSGYPRLLKRWKRGLTFDEAPVVFEIEKTDLAAFTGLLEDGSEKLEVFVRMIDFYSSEWFVLSPDGSKRKLPAPRSAELVALSQGYFYVRLKEALTVQGRELPPDSVIRFKKEAVDLSAAEVVFKPEPKQAIEKVQVNGAGQAFITLLDLVRSAVVRLDRDPAGEWVSTRLDFPKMGMIDFTLRDERDPTSVTTLQYADFLTPSTLYWVTDEGAAPRLEKVKQEPERFSPRPFEIVQYFSKSRDGTRIPYFVLKHKRTKLNGKNPTILYGYGGFEHSLTPSYSGVIGKAWLERGGVYVVSNIRGGGEFGPEWHQAALKENRQRAYDDFISVAEDLIARRITSPRHLGILGGSNGGLLTGAVMVQRPDLFNAVDIQVPLLDMLRYHKLLSGASWVAEYGDPEIPEEREYLSRYSPYQNLRAGVKYPVPFIFTSTKDDRVHPGHARKMAARMMELGHKVYYFENTEGGHGGSITPEQRAHMEALTYSYFWKRLGTAKPLKTVKAKTPRP